MRFEPLIHTHGATSKLFWQVFSLLGRYSDLGGLQADEGTFVSSNKSVCRVGEWLHSQPNTITADPHHD